MIPWLILWLLLHELVCVLVGCAFWLGWIAAAVVVAAGRLFELFVCLCSFILAVACGVGWVAVRSLAFLGLLVQLLLHGLGRSWSHQGCYWFLLVLLCGLGGLLLWWLLLFWLVAVRGGVCVCKLLGF